MRVDWKQDRLIPVKSFLQATVRLWRSVVLAYDIFHAGRHEVVRVPELSYPPIPDAPERAATWRTPVRGEDRLPPAFRTDHGLLGSCPGPARGDDSAARPSRWVPPNGVMST